MTRSRRSSTPVRRALREGSTLRPLVQDGLGALGPKSRASFHSDVAAVIADSLDLDEGLRRAHPNERRWDYLLGVLSDGAIVAVEVHSARDDEVRAVIEKRRAALGQLRAHLRDGARPKRWIWLAPGKTRMADTEKSKRLLDQHGITYAGARLLPKHLPEPPSSAPRGEAKKKPRGRG